MSQHGSQEGVEFNVCTRSQVCFIAQGENTLRSPKNVITNVFFQHFIFILLKCTLTNDCEFWRGLISLKLGQKIYEKIY